jgi:hypothetical protein
VLPDPVVPRKLRIAERTSIDVYVSVNEQGLVYQAEAYDGPPALRQLAVQAAKKAKFAPRKDNRLSSGTLVYYFEPR